MKRKKIEKINDAWAAALIVIIVYLITAAGFFIITNNNIVQSKNDIIKQIDAYTLPLD